MLYRWKMNLDNHLVQYLYSFIKYSNIALGYGGRGRYSYKWKNDWKLPKAANTLIFVKDCSIFWISFLWFLPSFSSCIYYFLLMLFVNDFRTSVILSLKKLKDWWTNRKTRSMLFVNKIIEHEAITILLLVGHEFTSVYTISCFSFNSLFIHFYFTYNQSVTSV